MFFEFCIGLLCISMLRAIEICYLREAEAERNEVTTEILRSSLPLGPECVCSVPTAWRSIITYRLLSATIGIFIVTESFKLLLNTKRALKFWVDYVRVYPVPQRLPASRSALRSRPESPRERLSSLCQVGTDASAVYACALQ